MRKRLTNAGYEPPTSTPEELARFLELELVQWAKVVKASGAAAG